MIITIINYGLGNPNSIQNMIKRIGGKCQISSDKNVIANADKLILPGVGHFKKGMENLRNSGLIEILNNRVLKNKIPVLGICLGMQLLTKHSEEGDCEGLGWIDAQTVKFRFTEESDLKIPHMGWNEVHYIKQSYINQDLSTNPRNYFVHSYYVKCNNQNDILATSHYGFDFTCAVEHENIIGMQFHPEKSHKYGMEILNNFCKQS